MQQKPSESIYSQTQQHLKQLYSDRQNLEANAHYVLSEIAKLEASLAAMENLTNQNNIATNVSQTGALLSAAVR